MVKITRELIHGAATQYGAWTRAQLDVLGVAWPPKQGWQNRLIGMEVEDSVWAQFVANREVRKSRRLSEKLGKEHALTLVGMSNRLRLAEWMDERESESFFAALQLLRRISDPEYTSVIRRKLLPGAE